MQYEALAANIFGVHGYSGCQTYQSPPRVPSSSAPSSRQLDLRRNANNSGPYSSPGHMIMSNLSGMPMSMPDMANMDPSTAASLRFHNVTPTVYDRSRMTYLDDRQRGASSQISQHGPSHPSDSHRPAAQSLQPRNHNTASQVADLPRLKTDSAMLNHASSSLLQYDSTQPDGSDWQPARPTFRISNYSTLSPQVESIRREAEEIQSARAISRSPTSPFDVLSLQSHPGHRRWRSEGDTLETFHQGAYDHQTHDLSSAMAHISPNLTPEIEMPVPQYRLPTSGQLLHIPSTNAALQVHGNSGRQSTSRHDWDYQRAPSGSQENTDGDRSPSEIPLSTASIANGKVVSDARKSARYTPYDLSPPSNPSPVSPNSQRGFIDLQALPIPVPNLNKKSRGRHVPLAESTSPDGSVCSESDGIVRVFTCTADGCRKCFARYEHLRRHIRSIHTYEKREFN